MVEKEKPTLFWASDSFNMATGYGTVSYYVLQGMKMTEHYKLAQLGFQFFGQPLQLNGITILPTGKKPYGEDILQGHLANVRPNILITLCDMFRIPWFKNLKMPEGMNTKWVAYFPLDAEEIPLGADEALKHADYRVAMSEFTKREAEKAGFKVDAMIPHGVDVSLYRPISKKEIIKRNNLLLYKYIEKPNKEKNGKLELNKEFITIKDAGLENKFIIGSVFRNCPRKNPLALVEGFYRYSKINPNAVLWLHTDPNDVQAVNIVAYAKRRGILNKIYYTAIHSVAYAAARMMMPDIYNMFDIHVLTTSGEGFGLPILESLACGVPNVMTDYTTAEELIGNDRGVRVKIKAYHYGAYLTKRAFVDVDDLVQAFIKLHDDKEFRKKCSENAFKFAQGYDWKIVNKMWDNLFQEIINGKNS